MRLPERFTSIPFTKSLEFSIYRLLEAFRQKRELWETSHPQFSGQCASVSIALVEDFLAKRGTLPPTPPALLQISLLEVSRVF